MEVVGIWWEYSFGHSETIRNSSFHSNPNRVCRVSNDSRWSRWWPIVMRQSQSYLSSQVGVISDNKPTLGMVTSILLPSYPTIVPQYPIYPRGKRLHNYGKYFFLMGKSTISMAIFSSFLYVYQRVFLGLTHYHAWWLNPQLPTCCRSCQTAGGFSERSLGSGQSKRRKGRRWGRLGSITWMLHEWWWWGDTSHELLTFQGGRKYIPGLPR